MRINRETKNVIRFPTSIKTKDWLPWSSWKNLRFPGRNPPNLANIPEAMGLYELAVCKGGTRRVVYLGSSGNLRDRLQAYQANGSHKDTQINKTLGHGMKIMARYRKQITSRRKLINRNMIGGEAATLFKYEIAENGLLETYDYSWNVRRNNGLRPIQFKGQWI